MRTFTVRTGAVALATAATLIGTTLTAAPAQAHPALAGSRPTAAAKLTPRTHFTMKPDGSSGLTAGGEGIPNVDIDKSTIRTYYNATAGIADKVSSPYISEMDRITNSPWRYLQKVAKADKAAKAYAKATHKKYKKPAIVLDADDTMLWTYDMEDGAMGFVFDPVVQDKEWVQKERFPATPGMVTFVERARQLGLTVFGLTGRNDGQKAATLANLTKVGYDEFDDANFYTKWVSGSTPTSDPSRTWFAGGPCADGVCTTVEFKAGTRKHIESLGYDIVLNVGDQWSDLQGGYADYVLKLPNPTYFLGSPDLDGTPAGKRYSPRTRFTMAADGSSGKTAGGEGIPNIDIVKSTIRTYYQATAGLADRTASPYITEITAKAAKEKSRLTTACTRAVAHHKNPAVVFDTDDTTLWTYDMEDGAMKFIFNPIVQNLEWVQLQRFPATPGMVDLVAAVHDAGCAVVGLTGRNDGQKDATLGNLTKVGYTDFTEDLFFTKWVSGTVPTGRPWLAGTPCADGVCTTIEYKSLTRKHLVDDLHYDVVANLGDQYSDLIGGYAKRAIKLPNPTYYLP